MTARIQRRQNRERKAAADRLLELLKTHDWNDAVPALDAELRQEAEEKEDGTEGR